MIEKQKPPFYGWLRKPAQTSCPFCLQAQSNAEPIHISEHEGWKAVLYAETEDLSAACVECSRCGITHNAKCFNVLGGCGIYNCPFNKTTPHRGGKCHYCSHLGARSIFNGHFFHGVCLKHYKAKRLKQLYKERDETMRVIEEEHRQKARRQFFLFCFVELSILIFGGIGYYVLFHSSP